MVIPGGNGWEEYVIPLEELGSDSIYEVKIMHPEVEQYIIDTDGDPPNILVDCITVTDGTQNASIAFPTAMHNNFQSAG